VQRFFEEQHATATHLPVATGRTVEQAGQELIYRAILQLGSEVKLLRDLITSHLPGGSDSGEFGMNATFDKDSATMEEMERALIEKALADNDNNRKEAARRLGISERTLYRKISKYDLR